MKLTKGRRDALEKVWIREVSNTLPHQSNARIYLQLEREGLVEQSKVERPSRYGSLMFRGWTLTHAGRLAYCMTCEDDPAESQREGG